MDKVTYSSPAKINLFLEVKGRREDGYHEILTWMQTIDICDSITIAKSPRDFSTLRSRDTSIPFGKRNLCIKAYETLRDQSSMEKSDTVEISLDKQIPLGSGLGGGSSNAASVITGLDELFNLGLDMRKRLDIAAQVGSDVPFFILGGGAIAQGRGEKLEQLAPLPKPIWLVVAKPEFSVSTGEAYKWLKKHKGSKSVDAGKLSKKIASGDLQFILDNMYNAFEPVIAEKFPQIDSIKKKMAEAGCLKSQMTGSGSGIFGICADEATAQAAASSLSGDHDIPFVAACKTI